MASIFEKPSFKWIAIGIGVFTTFIVVGAGVLGTYLREREAEQIAYKKYSVQKEYEDLFRSSMTRIYQNLKLDHFLAAFQNIKNMQQPKFEDKTRVDEYLEVLHRIGQGLLKSGLLKESESIYAMIRELDFNSEAASTALTEIDSRRKLQFARLYLSEGRIRLQEKKYRSALLELQKADIELNSIRSNNFTETKAEIEELQGLMREARFFTRLEDAGIRIEAAQRAFASKDYNKTQDEMSKASQFVGKAAFIHPDYPRIKELRKTLRDLESDLAYAIPNSMPIWNLKWKELAGRDPNFFFMDAYEFDISELSKSLIRIGMTYRRKKDSQFYVVRYRIYLANGGDFFNGHFLMPREDQAADTDLLQTTYEQEIPEKYRGLAIRRVELSIFNQYDQIVSRVTRAFKINS